jgi:hypothetical protein
MNYLKVYCNLIRKAENRTPPEGYTEKHHIFPKSIFGNNNRVVVLTAREHYIAHALLEKIFISRYGKTHWKTIKMSFAHLSFKGNKNLYCNSYLYECGKKRWSEIMKVKNPSKNGISDKQKKALLESRLGVSHSEETKQKIKNSLIGKKHTEERKLKNSKSTCKYKYKIISPDGYIFYETNMKKFCMNKDIDSGAMTRVAQGKFKQHKGWTVEIVAHLHP